MSDNIRVIERNKTRVIRWFRKSVYGTELKYAVDFAFEIRQLTGDRTLTPSTIATLESMGFDFKEVLESSVRGGLNG